MKKLQKIKFDDLTHPNYTWLQNQGGLCRQYANEQVDEMLNKGWQKANENDVVAQFVQYNPLPWKVKIHMPGMMYRANAQGYTKMIDQIEKGLSHYGVSFTSTIDKDTDAILMMTSVWVGATDGQIADLKILARKQGIKLGMFTMFESTKWIDSHVNEMSHLDFLIVPSGWNKECLEKQGFKKPIYVCPLPNSDDFKYLERPNKRDKFTFLMYNAMDYRKGFPEYLHAFKNEFKPDEPVKFILKTRENDSALRNMIRQDPIFASGQIEWIIETMPSYKVEVLHQETDCFVFPSKGEGWGYPPLEALITGNPVITTKAHSHLEWFNEACLEVKSSLVPASFELDGKPQEGAGNWYKPDVKDMQKQMRWIFEEWKAKGREAKIFKQAEKQSQLILDKFDKKVVAEKLLSILQNQNILEYETKIKRKRGRPKKNQDNQ